MSSFAAGLAHLGLRRGDKVALFSENSTRWLIADQGVMMNGAADAVSRPHDCTAKAAERSLAVTDPVHNAGVVVTLAYGHDAIGLCTVEYVTHLEPQKR